MRPKGESAAAGWAFATAAQGMDGGRRRARSYSPEKRSQMIERGDCAAGEACKCRTCARADRAPRVAVGKPFAANDFHFRGAFDHPGAAGVQQRIANLA